MIEIWKYCFVFLKYFNIPPPFKKATILKRERKGKGREKAKREGKPQARKRVTDRKRNCPGRKAKSAGRERGGESETAVFAKLKCVHVVLHKFDGK